MELRTWKLRSRMDRGLTAGSTSKLNGTLKDSSGSPRPMAPVALKPAGLGIGPAALLCGATARDDSKESTEGPQQPCATADTPLRLSGNVTFGPRTFSAVLAVQQPEGHWRAEEVSSRSGRYRRHRFNTEARVSVPLLLTSALPADSPQRHRLREGSVEEADSDGFEPSSADLRATSCKLESF